VEVETRYQPSPDQLALASTIEESLVELLPLSRLHASPIEDTKTWQSLDDMGIFAITAPEDEGGSGLGVVEESLIAWSLGRQLVSPAVLATMAATHAVANGRPVAPRGQRVAAGYRNAGRFIMLDDASAAHVLIRDTERAALYECGGVESRELDSRLWSVTLKQLASLGKPVAQVEPAQLLRLRLIDAAALAGIAQAAVEMAVAYALIREQFGRPIGTFQAIKHHCANMAMAARCARDQASFAAVALDERRDDASMQVESALLVAGSAAVDNAGKNIQIHGGMGFSDEADPHLLLKRAQLYLTLGGGLEATTQRLAGLPMTW
jgi:alkylation response protein AidB-like acyl-CoA dehydrogenase